MPLKGKAGSIASFSLGNGQYNRISKPLIVYIADDVEIKDRKPISIILRESAFNKVGFLE